MFKKRNNDFEARDPDVVNANPFGVFRTHSCTTILLWMCGKVKVQEVTSRSRIQGVRGSNPGKRSLRSFSRRISTLTLKIINIRWFM